MVIVDGAPAGASGTVTGGGSFQILPSTSNTLTIGFECLAHAVGDATQVRILPASEGGCELRQGGFTLASAPGRSAPGAVVATGSTATTTTSGTLDVCWKVKATFSDGTESTATGCDDLALPNVEPPPVTVPPVTTPPVTVPPIGAPKGFLSFMATAQVVPAMGYRFFSNEAWGTWNLSIGTGWGFNTTGDLAIAIGGLDGTTRGWCDHSVGSGSGYVSFGTSSYWLDIAWPATDGLTRTFSGPGVVGAMTWHPPSQLSGAGSCLAGTATSFFVDGWMIFS